MRILAVNMSLDAVTGGGTAERTFQFARYMASLGNECTVLTTETGMTPERRLALKGCRIVALPVLFKRFHIPRRGGIRDLVQAADIIHLMNHWTLLNAFVYRAARRLEKPYVVCPAGALPIFGRSRLLKRAYNVLAGRDIIRNARAHIAIADNEIAHFADYGITPERITTIPNGIDLRDYRSYDIAAFRNRTGLGHAPYILFAGRLNPIKGPDLLLSAFCRIPSAHNGYHLVLAGPDGGMAASLKDKASREGVLGRVHFTGYIGGRDKAAAYHGASFVVVPSRQEAMSIVVLEAGACGKPVLMTDQCGFPVVAQIGGGKIVKATESGIGEGLQDMMQDAGQREEMGKRLRQYVERYYSWDIIARSYLSLFEEVLRRPVP